MPAMARTWTVGVDAGGTWLRVLAENGAGQRWTVTSRATRDIAASLRALWRRRRLRAPSVEHLVVATRGVWTPSERRAAVRRLGGLARRVHVLSDVEAAYRGAIGERAGLLVLAGTGSIVLARSEAGAWVRAGGPRPPFGGGAASPLGRAWLAATNPMRARRLAVSSDAVARIAALAPRVLRLGRQGDGAARAVVARGSLALALGIRAATRSAALETPVTVSWAGGPLEGRAYRAPTWGNARGLGLDIAPVPPRPSALEARPARAAP